jgi:hypothetical protein
LRAERRRGITWLELAHDRLIDPIRRNNAAWRWKGVRCASRQAALWEREHRPRRLELGGEALAEAERWAAQHQDELTQTEQSFLETCVEARQRKTRHKQAILAIGVIAMLALILSAEAYWRWLRAQPWAHIADLISGQVFVLRGDVTSIGRSAGPMHNQIDVPYRTVSRLQLFVSRDLRAQDARSLNGTTINARFLRYGTEQELRDGDLITLVGQAPFRFFVAKFPLVPFLSPSPPKPSPSDNEVWALLIDGASRRAIPLIESEYFLAAGEGGDLAVENSRTAGSLLRITRGEELEVEALNSDDAHHLLAMLKYEDRSYLAVEIPAGKEVGELLKGVHGAEYLSKISFCIGPALPRREATVVNDEPTNYMEIESDEEPSCTLGPIQIVQLVH